MDYIAGPEANAQSAEYFGEAPANAKACDLTADKTLLRHLPRRGRGLRRQDLVLDHADQAVPRRPHGRQVHRLRRVDAGLDRDQGLTVDVRSAAPPPRAPGRAAARATDAVAGRGLPRGAGGAVRHRVLGPEQLHRRGRADLDAGQLPRPVHDRRLPHGHPAHAGHRGAGDGRRRADRVPGRVLHGEGRLARARSGCWSSRC